MWQIRKSFKIGVAVINRQINIFVKRNIGEQILNLRGSLKRTKKESLLISGTKGKRISITAVRGNVRF